MKRQQEAGNGWSILGTYELDRAVRGDANGIAWKIIPLNISRSHVLGIRA